jgi:serine/threonine protein kinase
MFRSFNQIAAMKQLDYSKMPAKDRKQILEEVYVPVPHLVCLGALLISIVKSFYSPVLVHSSILSLARRDINRRILDSLKSRHVVQLVDKILDRTDQKMYIIMEASPIYLSSIFLFILTANHHPSSLLPDNNSQNEQYCGGGDLARTLTTYKNQRKTIPEPLIWNYFIQLVLGLNHCHHPEERTAGPGEGVGPSPSSASSSSAGGLGSMGQETGLRRKLEALGIEEGGTGSASSSSGFGSGLGLGTGAGAGAGVRRKSMREVTGQVLHRDLKPENSQCSFSRYELLGGWGG